METTYKEFKMMSLRPAFYNGTVFEIDVDFNSASLFRTDITVAKAINMTVGDTARISAKICGEDKDYDYITVYMCGDELSDFIGRYGTDKISGKVRMKLEQIYAVYDSDDYSLEPKKEEIIAYRLVEIIGDEHA